MSKVFKPGLYRHYRDGALYTALGLANHHDWKRPVVLYISHTYGHLICRPLLGWEGDPDGWLDDVEVAGKLIPRFDFMSHVPTLIPLGSSISMSEPTGNPTKKEV